MDAAVALELVKLLLQVTTADHVLTRAERAHLTEVARGTCGGRQDEAVALIEAVCDGTQKLPAPNLGLLRAHRPDVLRAVAHAGAVDGVHEEEEAMVRLIGELLR